MISTITPQLLTTESTCRLCSYNRSFNGRLGSLDELYAMTSDISVGKLEIEAREFVDHGGGSPEEANERCRKERVLVHRLDCFIAPVLMVLNLVSYLDRGNIGFAATQGMTQDIHLKGNQLNVSISDSCLYFTFFFSSVLY